MSNTESLARFGPAMALRSVDSGAADSFFLVALGTETLLDRDLAIRAALQTRRPQRCVDPYGNEVFTGWPGSHFV
jgi:hypothetical protein